MAGTESYRSLWIPAYSAQVSTIQPRPFTRLVQRITLLGPDYSKFALYKGLVITDLYLRTTTNLGVRNTASLTPPIEIRSGESAIGVWTGGNTAAGTISVLTIEWEDAKL